MQHTDHVHAMISDAVVDDVTAHAMTAIPFSNIFTGSATLGLVRH